ncbi:hypothetical protein F511_40245 [Dorcoceras hygrometricum]|uniref:Uncharacterized protein n=1 Tax=Dorcoceras hygrometricum TaxID=472368 RepID=A0A2Z7BLG0_9LAMI|nr:hypothetical protein F511_40245 [Dorcoceras hygrometricum]
MTGKTFSSSPEDRPPASRSASVHSRPTDLQTSRSASVHLTTYRPSDLQIFLSSSPDLQTSGPLDLPQFISRPHGSDVVTTHWLDKIRLHQNS